MKKSQALVDGFVPRNRPSNSSASKDGVSEVRHEKKPSQPAPRKAVYNNDLEETLNNLDIEDKSTMNHESSQSERARRRRKRSIKKDRKLTEKLDRRNDKRQRKGKKPLSLSQFKRRRIVKRVILLILLVAIIFCGVNIYKALNSFSSLVGGNIINIIKKDRLKEDSNGRTNVLIFGTSPEGWEGEDLADSIMVASINQDTKEVYTMSIPRDLWVKHSCSGWLNTTAGKANESYGCGKYTALAQGEDEEAAELAGQEEMASAVSSVLGLDIHYKVHANWQVLVGIVDSLGGIDLTIEVYDGSSEMYDVATGIRYTNGEEVHLDGAQALALSRARGSEGGYGLGGGNFDREKNQQKILKAIADKIKTSGKYNPATLLSMLEALGDNIKTSVITSELQTIADLAQDFDVNNIKSLPFVDSDNDINLMTTGNVSGASVVVPTAGTFVYSDIQAYVARNTIYDPAIREEANIVILNGTSTSGLAAKYEVSLVSEGYIISQIDSAPTQDYIVTEIYVLNQDKPETAKKLAEKFGVSVSEAIPDWLSDYEADVVVVLGSDQ